ncbi:Nitrate transporter [Fusarium oxysporum f. sp. albedinis]|nr:Uncharacterized protein HZ326_27788 [Fusarium oxysporum f. sp. albedinis]KAJ0131853.1 Nitrate transporter [Fusarium oxysporum f. sp. albedinis]
MAVNVFVKFQCWPKNDNQNASKIDDRLKVNGSKSWARRAFERGVWVRREERDLSDWEAELKTNYNDTGLKKWLMKRNLYVILLGLRINHGRMSRLLGGI